MPELPTAPEPPTDPTEHGEDDIVAQLMRQAGPRPSMPESVSGDLRQRTRNHWQGMVARRKAQKRRHLWVAAAAGLALAVTGWFTWQQAFQRSSPSPATIARVESLVGTVQELTEEATEQTVGQDLVVGQTLAAGAVIETAEGGLSALLLNGGAALRLDTASRVRLLADGGLVLERGAVYIDAGTVAASVTVQTPFGLARDIGTQFEVRLDDDAWQVAVREGEVRVELVSGHHTALAGERLYLTSEGAVTRRSESPHADRWAWAREAAPSVDLGGKTLAEALHWMVRETGWKLAFEDPELEAEVQRIQVYGSVGDLRPGEVPELLPSAGLESALADGLLTIRRGPR